MLFSILPVHYILFYLLFEVYLSKAAMFRQLIPRASPHRKRLFSTSAQRSGYEQTIWNLKIGSHTRVIFQGFTGITHSPHP